jgi:CRISPR system Cascade subunit CasB
MLGTADSFTELTHHLRGAVQLLRAGGAPLDYGLLADQLVVWQVHGPGPVQLKWGREFYRTRRTALPDDQPSA